MGQLPNYRVIVQRSFSQVGIGYTGPLLIKEEPPETNLL